MKLQHKLNQLFLAQFSKLVAIHPNRESRHGAQRKGGWVITGVVWIGLGNFVAGIFLSAGPVYYGYMTGDADRFSEFFTAINAYGFQNTGTPRVQEMLWNYHVEGHASLGSGISAFPSVHVGMATLIGLYLWRKLGRFGAVALLFPLAIQIFSVLLGWHYAVDGYFSIAVVLVAWYFCAYRYSFGERHT